MKNLVLLAPIVSLLLLAAHFMRAQAWVPVGVCLALPALLLWRSRWAALAVECALLLGAIEWLRTLVALASARIALGQPYARMVLVIGLVAIATLLSAAVFWLPAIRRRYGASLDLATPD